MSSSWQSLFNVELDLKAQYHEVECSVGLADLHGEELYLCSGPEALKFLNSYNSQDILKIPEGGLALGTFQTQKGKLVSDVVLLRFSEGVGMFFPPAYGVKVFEHLAVFLQFADCQWENISERWVHLALIGPLASRVLEVFGGVAHETRLNRVEFSDAEIMFFPTERLGRPAWELLLPAAHAERLIRAYLKPEVPVLSAELLEVLRVEAGYPRMGVDMNESHLVAEVGLDRRATSFTKGCYLGQETTARVNSQGRINRKLLALRFNRPLAVSLPCPLLKQGQEVGQVTSCIEVPTDSRILALAMVKTAALESDLPFQVLQAGQVAEGVLL